MQRIIKNNFNIFHLGIIIIIAIFIILIVISINQLLNQNQKITSIDNYATYIKNLPDNQKNDLFSSLYSAIDTNLPEDEQPPHSGALIRENSFSNNVSDDINTSNFLVDIASVQQTYHVYFSWSIKPNQIIGTSVAIHCPTQKESNYPNFKCRDTLQQEAEKSTDYSKLFPIIKDLPINVEYYENNYTNYIHYNISYKITADNNLILLIINYSGANYEDALARISDRGYNAKDYPIGYLNKESHSIIISAPNTYNDTILDFFHNQGYSLEEFSINYQQ